MKLFIKKTILIVLVFSIGILVFTIGNFQYYSSNFDFRINDETIILGHSHSACAFNDDLIDGVTNLSQSGESYFYTYYKIQELISQNKIKTILLEYSNNQLYKNKDQWIWGDNSMSAYLPRHLAFMDQQGLELLYTNNSSDLPSIFLTSVKKIFIKNISGNTQIDNDFGGYESRDNALNFDSKKDSVLESKLIEADKISLTNIRYLEKIVFMCKKNNIELIFIRSPQHSSFNRENEVYFLKLKNTKFKDIEFLDFDKFPLRNEEFSDAGHMNKYGAARFSKWFKNQLEDNLLFKTNKSKLVEFAIKKLIE